LERDIGRSSINTALLIARLALGGVFLVAGLSKLADRPGSQPAVIDFGVPTPLKMLLPLAEFAGAATLIPSGSAATVGA
jgi:uncharacterized membrane protein YphA (DoxX/SURF4 family)